MLPYTAYANSRVEFDALLDGEVSVQVYNRGSFGTSSVYYLRVHEVVATAPTATRTQTPELSPTPSPTGTQGQPTPSPTGTGTQSAPTATSTQGPYPNPPTVTPTTDPNPYPAAVPTGQAGHGSQKSGWLDLAGLWRRLTKPRPRVHYQAAEPPGKDAVIFTLSLKMRREAP